MTEQTRADARPLRNTAFGRVVCELAEERGIPATPGAIGSLAEQAGLEGWRVINRMAGADMTYKGRSLGLLVDALELDGEERRRLALAFTFEEDPAAVARD